MVYPNIDYVSTPESESGLPQMADNKKKSSESSSNYGPSNLLKNTLVVMSNKARRRSALIRRCLYAIGGLAVLAIWIGVMLAFANQEVKYARNNKTKDISRKGPAGQAKLSGEPLFKGTLRQFDVASRKLTVQWAGVYYNETTEDNFPPLLTETGENGELNSIAVYQDIKAVRDLEMEALLADSNDTDLTGIPWYRLENRTAKRIGSVGINEWDTFNTEIDISQANPGKVWQQPLFGYPFDTWAGSIVLVANFPSSAASVNMTGSFVFPFSHITLTDSILNWKIEASSTDSCTAEDGSETVTDHCELHINFTAKRPAIVIFCVIVVVIINWLSTLAIFGLTCESVILKRPYILSEIDILGVCFAALFALPSVRSLLPAAPEFAAIIDLIGILPNVIIISICTTIVAFDRIFYRKREEDPEDN